MRCSVPQRWRHFKGIVPHRLNKSFAFCFVNFIRTVVLAVTSACHAHARAVAAGELLLGAAGQLEHRCVGGGERARFRVVVNCPVVRADQQGALFGIGGCKKLFVILVFGFPQREIGIVPKKRVLP